MVHIRLIDQLNSIKLKHIGIGHVSSLWEKFGNVIISDETIKSFGNTHNVKRAVLQVLLIDWLSIGKVKDTTVAWTSEYKKVRYETYEREGLHRAKEVGRYRRRDRRDHERYER